MDINGNAGGNPAAYRGDKEAKEVDSVAIGFTGGEAGGGCGNNDANGDEGVNEALGTMVGE